MVQQSTVAADYNLIVPQCLLRGQAGVGVTWADENSLNLG
jgi:hypothetical protein